MGWLSPVLLLAAVESCGIPRNPRVLCLLAPLILDPKNWVFPSRQSSVLWYARVGKGSFQPGLATTLGRTTRNKKILNANCYWSCTQVLPCPYSKFIFLVGGKAGGGRRAGNGSTKMLRKWGQRVSPLQSAKHFLPIGFPKRPNLNLGS